MKNILFLLSIIPGSCLLHSQKEVVLDEEIITFVEEQPEFPGGEAAMADFIQKNLIYPEYAKEANITGKVYVQFDIATDGSVTNVVCKKGIDSFCDREAVRVVKIMPKWRPGKQNGRPVKVRYLLPIKFEMR